MKITKYIEDKKLSPTANLWNLVKTRGEGFDRGVARNWPNYIDKLNEELNSDITIPYYNLRHTLLSAAKTHLSQDDFSVVDQFAGHANGRISASTAAYLAANLAKTKKLVDAVAKFIPIDTVGLAAKFWETLKRCGE